MRIAVPRERAPRESRVALVPESVAKLVKSGATVSIEHDAGLAAGFPDAQYTAAGATIANDFAATVSGADLICRVHPPSATDPAPPPNGSAVVSYWLPGGTPEVLAELGSRQVRLLALERVPRITRAQSMDVLSSQATVSGYKAVLLGASALPKMLPMLSTAAGTLAPAKVFVIGAGVAGLQAIATARRLGGLVSAFDVRAAAQEQIQSLGATPLKIDLGGNAEGGGGYAKAQSEDQARLTQEAIAKHIAGVDLVITTAAIPGKRAPILITKAAVQGMKTGSVIIDLASETGGNCEFTKPGETVDAGGVQVIGPLGLPSTAAFHASQMLSRNILTFVTHITKDNTLNIDASDEITGAMLVK
ncbi:MAG TPA: NAD(P) transhydrogenase subunit alpha, partial [Gemmatimonadaceae bacterium]